MKFVVPKRIGCPGASSLPTSSTRLYSISLFTAWLQENIRRDIQLKANDITFGQGSSSRIIYANPFALTVPDGANEIFTRGDEATNEQFAKIFKFWNQLGPANAITLPVNMPDGSVYYMTVKPDATFVTNYGGETPEGWQYTPNRFVYLGNGAPQGLISAAGAPDQTKVSTVLNGTLQTLDLYRRPEGEPASADVLVDSVSDTPEAGYIYTFKPRA